MKKGNKKLHRNNWFDYLNIAVMAFLCITILFPFWDMLMRSLSDASGSSSLTMVLWPKGFTLGSYKYMLRDSDVIHAYGVTIARTVSGTVLSLIVTVMGAYPLSKKDLPYRNVITTMFLIPMFFSGGLIPSYLLNRSLGLVDNFLVYIVPGALNIYNIILTRNYLMSMDKALEESAFIDGASYWVILSRIQVPLMKPILATITLWVAVGQWNSWFDSLIYARGKNLEVMQLLLRRMMDNTQMMSEEMQAFVEMSGLDAASVTSNSARMAATIITILPIMMVYPFVQKHFVKGIMVGSLKG